MTLPDGTNPAAPENKALGAGPSPQSREVQDAFDDFLAAFEEFKSANDARLSELEKRSSADAVTSDKVERINKALDQHKARMDEMLLALRRPELGEAKGRASAQSREHKSAFERYVRKGDAQELVNYELKALSSSSDPDGGYLVPSETEALIDKVLKDVSPIRAIATVRQIGAASFKKPMSIGGLDSGWVGESATRPETASSTISVMEFPAMELYAMPAATQSLLDDSYVNVDEWLAGEIQHEFAAQEGAAFVTGDGVNKPRGFTAYDKAADASWAWGKIGYLVTGQSGGFASTNPADTLIDLIYAPKQAYRQNGRWVMNRSVEAQIRKFKDGEGNYLWQPGASAGDPATLLGYPITESEDMPDIAADSYSIAFGDFQRGYLIVDRVGVRVLRDPYTAKPYVLFYTTKRVGGGVQNFEAIKLLKFGTA